MEKILEIAKERMNHPFMGSFTVGFIMWNWRAVLYATTGNADASARIENIIAVTIGTGEQKSWTFICEPLIFAFLVAVLILPVGTFLLEIWNHLALVLEGNTKDWITNKWNTSDDIKFRQTRDINSYARASVGELWNLANNSASVSSSDVHKHLGNLTQLLEPVRNNNAAEISRTWRNLPEPYKS
ncbi:hypothetical protein [Bdellovibrio bacteriovorus]|uniref:hypothetical protein n=1 Tax=Bdellovibrio TaxID=958 RepID=UPI0035A997ED